MKVTMNCEERTRAFKSKEEMETDSSMTQKKETLAGHFAFVPRGVVASLPPLSFGLL